MKTFAQIAVMACLAFLLSIAGYAADRPQAAPVTALPTMALAQAEPAVDAAISPGAAPETSSEPVRKSKPMAKAPAMPAQHLQTTESRPEIAAAAARQGMPELSKQSVTAAYAPPDRPTKVGGLSYDQLNRRIEALAREVALLQADMNRLTAREAETK